MTYTEFVGRIYAPPACCDAPNSTYQTFLEQKLAAVDTDMTDVGAGVRKEVHNRYFYNLFACQIHAGLSLQGSLDLVQDELVDSGGKNDVDSLTTFKTLLTIMDTWLGVRYTGQVDDAALAAFYQEVAESIPHIEVS